MNFEEKTITKEQVFKGKVLNVEVHTVSLPDGKTSTREVIKHNGGVGILAKTIDNEILLVRQYRKAVESVTLEIPAGKLELGEDVLECAVRELSEETGYDVKKSALEKIGVIHVSVGYSSEALHLYYAKDLENQKKLHLDSDEFAVCEKYNLDEVYNLLEEGKITDAKTQVALLWLKDKERR